MWYYIMFTILYCIGILVERSRYDTTTYSATPRKLWGPIEFTQNAFLTLKTRY